MLTKRIFLLKKTWKIINYFLITIKNYYFFFLKSCNESKILKISVKFGSFLHRSIIFSQLGNEFYYILKNPNIAFFLIFVLKFLKIKTWNLIGQILTFNIQKNIFFRSSLIILDFYYQTIASSSKKQCLILNIIFPFSWIYKIGKEETCNIKYSMRLYISGFSSQILEYIENFHFKFFNIFSQIFFIFSSRIGQQIFWEFYRLKKKKIFKFEKFLEKLFLIFPEKNNFNLIFNFIKNQNVRILINKLKIFKNRKLKLFNALFNFLIFLMSFSKNNFQKNNKFFFICKIYKNILAVKKQFLIKFFADIVVEKKFLKTFFLQQYLQKKIYKNKMKNSLQKKKNFLTFLNMILNIINKKAFFVFFGEYCFGYFKIFKRTLISNFKNDFNLISDSNTKKQIKLIFFNLKLYFLSSIFFFKKKNINNSLFRFLFFQISLKFSLYIKKLRRKILFFLFFKEKFFINKFQKKKFKKRFFFESLKIKVPLIFCKKFFFFLNLEIFNIES